MIKYECSNCGIWYNERLETFKPSIEAREWALETGNISHGYCKLCFDKIMERLELDKIIGIGSSDESIIRRLQA